MFHFPRQGLLYVAIIMEIVSFSTASVQNNGGNFKVVKPSTTPLDVVEPTSSPSSFPSLTIMSITDLPNFQWQTPQSTSPTNVAFDMTLSPSLISPNIFTSSPSDFASPSFQSETQQSMSPSNSTFDMTLSPSFLNSTDKFTSSPSAFTLPSLSPSVSNTTNVPTTTTTNVPSSFDTYAPSIEISQVNITIVFHGVKDHLSNPKLTMLARETLKYLYMSGIHVDRVSILSQSFVNSRRILARSLAVAFDIEGHSSPNDFSTRIHFLLNDNFSDYRNFLVDSLPMLKPLEAGMTTSPTRSPTIVKEQNEFIAKSNESPVNWWLVGSAITLSIIAILALLFVFRSRQNRRRQSRQFPMEQTAAAVSVGVVLKEYLDFF
jgi:hypothetical protein